MGTVPDTLPPRSKHLIKPGDGISSEKICNELGTSNIASKSVALPSPESQDEFDLCDPERNSAVVVPQRARTCPPLLDAILSASARHFSTLPQQRQLEITRYYGLKDGLAIGEESMLAYHSRSIAGLRAASLEPNATMDENLLAAVHHVWANRLLILGAHVIQYCFPPVPTPRASFQQRCALYEHLLHLRQSWMTSAPLAFTPFLSPSAPLSECFIFFPQQRFLNDTHIVARNRLGLSTCSSPYRTLHVDRLRSHVSHRRAVTVLNEKIRTTVREICGVAVANRQSPTAALTASLAVVRGAEAFCEASRAEQEALPGLGRLKT
ncbi:uncharacterized protein BP01DRAFT_393305 [Aspergillus saccharolyticus JOP 1030-1]|uniref:Uncharacterized protein n=1 Tax=Aspergillus saccharolyticus JOP 1030-1 TaxID=1450539 RepID=A0A318ZB74_9EURO|nr:hypothetical protein BP01DRAFT_393305 [Aspergillus saccharolyticus JOP 1030-1]PYH43717.1 hypothetical protein BP01DRAFT_393305 [Aspergillus saccharolyticus JOP 1030-1]